MKITAYYVDSGGQSYGPMSGKASSAKYHREARAGKGPKIRSYESPWVVFDLMRGRERATHDELKRTVPSELELPMTISVGPPIAIDEAMRQLGVWWHESLIEGIVYRVEREGRVDFLAKWVKSDYVPGRYLPEISGEPEVWNWRPSK